jgi:hypothetical protein
MRMLMHMTPMLKFNMHMSMHDHGELQRAAHAEGVSAAEMLRRALRELLERRAALPTTATHDAVALPEQLPPPPVDVSGGNEPAPVAASAVSTTET